jgi:tetratricopeptide (TPR) repeat protein
MPVATRRVRQRAKGVIDPRLGQRLRALRLGRGLTQQELAGSDFTKSFVSLVEAGRTRMSLRAASILAERLGVSAADLVREDAPSATAYAVVRAEGLLASGKADEALRELERTPSSRRPGDEADRLRMRGRAQLELSRERDALVSLDDARRAYLARGDREGATRTMFDLARLHARVDQQAEALNYALQCEHAINERVIVDRSFELRVAEFLAAVAVNVGDFAAADLRAERARTLAEDVGDPRTVASLYENLMSTRERQGDHEGALLYARKALELYERLADERAIGSAWNSLGWVHVQRGHLGKAREALDRAEAHARTHGDQRLLGYVLQNRAELELARDNAAGAAQFAEQSIAVEGASPRCKAISTLVRAQALARSDASDAVVTKAFAAAAEALEPHGRRLLARARQAEFAALSARGHHRQANAAGARALELLRPAL